MDAVVSLIDLFKPGDIYANVDVIATWVLTHVTPVLVIIAMWIRLTETQLDSFTGQSRYAMAVRDCFWYGFLLASYFALGSLVSYAFNTFYGMFNEKGSFEVVFAQMQHFMEAINAMDKTENDGPLDHLVNGVAAIAALPLLGTAALIHYVSLVLVVCVLIFMRQALAIGYGLAFVWGLIAIPLAITNQWKVLRGWGIFAGAILLWPIVESILIWFFAPLLTNAAHHLISGDAGSFVAEKSSVYLLYTVLNFLICALLAAAPLIAGALAANNSAMNSLVMPFVGGALAATAATLQSTRARLTGGARAMGSAMGDTTVAGATGLKAYMSGQRVGGSGPAAASPMRSATPISGGVRSTPSAPATPAVTASASAVSGATAEASGGGGAQSKPKLAAVAVGGQQVAAAAQAGESGIPDRGEAPEVRREPARRKRKRSAAESRRAHFIRQQVDK
ncbi:MAG: Antifreeze glycoprotein [Gammaproteobacteria bacterium]|nr:MAG: Antifreeze glycoprotein [Gammaproteobacteria bacterium]TND01594.1 MAG: Antifreeze glycoprotein [Gammaproteobacteria bacterium]